MKIFYDLSKVKDSQTFPYDAPLIKGAGLGLTVFLLLSSLTVFSGVQSHLLPYLTESWFFVRWTVYIFAYLIGSLAPDVINTICAAYIVSAILRKDYTTIEAKVLIAFCALLCIGLTYYSFCMSGNSSVAIGNDIKTESLVSDATTLSKLDSTHAAALAGIELAYSENLTRANAPFAVQLDAISKTYDNQVAVLQGQIAAIDKGSTKENYLYAAKQKKPLSEKIGKLEAAKLKAIAPVLDAQRIANDSLTAQKARQVEKANALHSFDRNRTTAGTDSRNGEVMATSTLFTSLFSALSAWAVFGCLLLTVILSILFNRNGIVPSVALSNFDFSESWILEVLSYPFAWVRHHSVNRVRRAYAALPVIVAPVVESEIFGGEFNQVIKGKAATDTDGDGIAGAANTDETDGEEFTASMPISMNLDTPENGQIISVITDTDTFRKIKGNTYVCARSGCANNFTARTYNHSFCCDGCKAEHHAIMHGKPFDAKLWKSRTKTRKK